MGQLKNLGDFSSVGHSLGHLATSIILGYLKTFISFSHFTTLDHFSNLSYLGSLTILTV